MHSDTHSTIVEDDQEICHLSTKLTTNSYTCYSDRTWSRPSYEMC